MDSNLSWAKQEHQNGWGFRLLPLPADRSERFLYAGDQENPRDHSKPKRTPNEWKGFELTGKAWKDLQFVWVLSMSYLLRVTPSPNVCVDRKGMLSSLKLGLDIWCGHVGHASVIQSMRRTWTPTTSFVLKDAEDIEMTGAQELTETLFSPMPSHF